MLPEPDSGVLSRQASSRRIKFDREAYVLTIGDARLRRGGKEHAIRTIAFTGESNTDDRPDTGPKLPKNGVQFDLALRSMDRLNVLNVKTAAASYAEVVNNARRLYEALIGARFLVHDEHGTLSPYRLFL